jgi:hypothetical protein
MIHKSGPVAYWQRVNDALVEGDKPPLGSSEAYDFYKSGLSSEDALILKRFGAEQTAPRDHSSWLQPSQQVDSTDDRPVNSF